MTIETFRENLKKGLYNIGKWKPKLRPTKACKENIEKILEFDAEQGENGRRKTTRADYAIKLHRFAEFLGSKKFIDVSKKDVKDYLVSLTDKDKGLKDSSKTLHKIVLRLFFLWLSDDKSYPECVSWMEDVKFKNSPITANDILTPEEIKLMIDKAEDWKEKAIISCLFESGCRAQEFLNMTVGDVKDALEARSDMVSVLVNPNHDGKTPAATRKVYFINSIPYIKEYLKHHPKKDDLEAPLWYVDYYFADKENKDKKISQLSKPVLNRLLKRCAVRAGIKKRVFSHLYRHSRCNNDAKVLTKSLLDIKFGWTPNSLMSNRYTHHTEETLREEWRKINNLPTERLEEFVSDLKPRRCANCGETNPCELSYCLKCNLSIDPEEIKKKKQDEMNMIERLIEKKIDELLLREHNIVERAKKL